RLKVPPQVGLLVGFERVGPVVAAFEGGPHRPGEVPGLDLSRFTCRTVVADEGPEDLGAGGVSALVKRGERRDQFVCPRTVFSVETMKRAEGNGVGGAKAPRIALNPVRECGVIEVPGFGNAHSGFVEDI